MCGIAGIAGLSPVNPAAIGRMTDLMAHRGPDGEGIWRSPDGRVGLGHRRLAILDLSERGLQPMIDGGGDLCITYNGELYNYVELRERLKSTGSKFRTDTDTEVVLEAYRVWGAACLQEFNGMFAFAINDGRTNTLFCARDRYGEKPFLFSAGDGWFAFASEYKALLALDGIDSAIDDILLLRFLRHPADGLDHGRETIFGGIRQLLPAESMLVDLNDLSWTSSIYWQPRRDHMEVPASEAAAVDRFRELLIDSVRLRLRSDVPVGSCLSGGLDSSAIACISRPLMGDGQPYHVFTGRFPGSDRDEGAWAAQIAARADLTQHEAFPTAKGFIDEIGDFIWFNELPVDSASQYAQWSVFRLAAGTGVTVLLDGQGGDEILAGYEQYFAAYLRSRRAAGEDIADEEASIRERYPQALSVADQQWKTALPRRLRQAAAHGLNRGSDLMFGIKEDYARRLESSSGDGAPATLHAALEQDACRGFLTTLLRYGDRNSMAHSREVRLPFCDHRIAELVFSLPVEFLMGGAQTKRLLREAMRGILPEPVRTRWDKQGFLPPQADWFRAGLLDAAEDVFNDPGFANNSPWDAKWWRRAAGRLRRGDDSMAAPVWKPFIAELWRRDFVGRARDLPRTPPLAGGSA
ncbi:MAG: asparagine synthase (glutamine-hydrolyzing) [Alphaproteobacteria bacterium]